MEQGHKRVTVKATGLWVGGGVEFCHSTCNASSIRRKAENESVLMGKECLNTRFLGSLCLPSYVRYYYMIYLTLTFCRTLYV